MRPPPMGTCWYEYMRVRERVCVCVWYTQESACGTSLTQSATRTVEKRRERRDHACGTRAARVVRGHLVDDAPALLRPSSAAGKRPRISRRSHRTWMRKRAHPAATHPRTADDADDQEVTERLVGLDAMTAPAAGGSAPTLHQLLGDEREGDVAMTGFLLKRGYAFGNMFSCCPSCCGCKPRWKKRFFVLNGAYLFRFPSQESNARPKGVPIPIGDAHFDSVSMGDGDMDDVNLETLIRVSTIRKEYLLRAPTVEKRNEWIRALRRAKERTIKVALGHAPESRAAAFARETGDRLFNDGIKREVQRAKNEIEMQSAAFGAGSSSMF